MITKYVVVFASDDIKEDGVEHGAWFDSLKDAQKFMDSWEKVYKVEITGVD